MLTKLARHQPKNTDKIVPTKTTGPDSCESSVKIIIRVDPGKKLPKKYRPSTKIETKAATYTYLLSIEDSIATSSATPGTAVFNNPRTQKMTSETPAIIQT